MQCLQFDFDIYTGRQVQAHQGIHSLWSRVHDVDQAFMCTHFELFPRILILVHRTENGNYLFLSWRGIGPDTPAPERFAVSTIFSAD